MPLVLLCGFPCSGKSRRAVQLRSHLEAAGRKALVVEPSLGAERSAVYADSQKEKELWGTLKAEVERKVNKEDVVILDYLNYIKSYRYELFCLIKHARTPHCLIHCETAVDICSAWNLEREPESQYSQEVFDGLVMRFESPDSRNRWDSPLFTVQKDDTLPFQAICDAIFHRKAPPPNQSTQNQPLSSTNFLYELDKVTQDMLMAILNAQKTSLPGDRIVLPGATEKIELSHNLSMAELRKLRRQFITYTKLHPTENIGHIANMFVQYLNKSTH
ncbi:protein KTI12 homolog [Callorhinchus milii]|uniref:Protein KTI12 homolog n=1 Tax=Callorhinchus milii TaxID=7868 RepID=V9L920_CALMI|nr:protein KTI12 homolog [Callorhinchus milii]|eukprot:gi/632979068/ref/XP_007906264.1/ PREDICTED: protein KTI12 homolog [Callorhinchus milii]